MTTTPDDPFGSFQDYPDEVDMTAVVPVPAPAPPLPPPPAAYQDPARAGVAPGLVNPGLGALEHPVVTPSGAFRPSMGALSTVYVPPKAPTGPLTGVLRIDVTEIQVDGRDEFPGEPRRLRNTFRTIDEARAFLKALAETKKLVVVSYGRGDKPGIPDEKTYWGSVMETQAQAWAPIGMAKKCYVKWRFDVVET